LLAALKLPPVAALVIVSLAAGCVHSPSPPESSASYAGSRRFSIETFDGRLLAYQIFLATNRVRADYGLNPLYDMAELDSAADLQAEHTSLMALNEHDNPVRGEHTVSDRVAKAGVVAVFAAENAIVEPARLPSEAPDRDYTYAQVAETIVQDWMGSPGHRVNILASRFNRLGCAARAGHIAPWDQRIYAIQDFCEVDERAGEVPKTYTQPRGMVSPRLVLPN
jgi:uncharacterized protein YkwD